MNIPNSVTHKNPHQLQAKMPWRLFVVHLVLSAAVNFLLPGQALAPHCRTAR